MRVATINGQKSKPTRKIFAICLCDDLRMEAEIRTLLGKCTFCSACSRRSKFSQYIVQKHNAKIRPKSFSKLIKAMTTTQDEWTWLLTKKTKNTDRQNFALVP